MRRAILLLAAVLATADAAKAEPAGTATALLRRLYAEHDAMAHGGPAPVPGLHEALQAELSSTAAADDERVRAALGFVLAGGDAERTADALRQGGGAAAAQTIADGVAAYRAGRLDDARRLLFAVDARAQDPVLAGAVALIQALLTPAAEPAAAMARFADAALLAPGTLVEESALRRQLALGGGDADQLVDIGGRYLRRFPRSAYLAPFLAQLADHVVAAPDTTGDAMLVGLSGPLGRLEPAVRLGFTLQIAAQSVKAGRVGLASRAADAALALATPSSEAVLRAQLYRAAALVLRDSAAGSAALRALEAARLDQQDTSIRESALRLADAMTQPPAGDEPAAAAQRGPQREFAAPAGLAAALRRVTEVDAMIAAAP